MRLVLRGELGGGGRSDPPRTPAGRGGSSSRSPLPPQSLPGWTEVAEPGEHLALGAAEHMRGQQPSSYVHEGGVCGAAEGRGAGSAEALFFSWEARGRCDVEGSPRGPGSVYEKFLKASRSKAVSRRRCSSVRWVFLLPVAGAAAGSRPAYHTGLARFMVVRSLGFT